MTMCSNIIKQSAIRCFSTSKFKIYSNIKVIKKLYSTSNSKGIKCPEQEQVCESISTRKGQKLNFWNLRGQPKVSKKLKEINGALRETRIINDHSLGFSYVRLDLHDPLFISLMTNMRSQKTLDNQEILLEGRRLILEALRCNFRLHSLIFSQIEQLQLIKKEVLQAIEIMNSKVYKVPQQDLKTWSSLATAPGLMAIFKRPSEQESLFFLRKSDNLPITVICDNIREPSNMGSIIRTCAAASCEQVLITRGCCDPWESKALRSGCGGQFQVCIRHKVDWNELPLFISPNITNDLCVFIAESNLIHIENSRVLNYSDLTQVGAQNIVIIGGESHGVSKDAYKFLKRFGSKGTCLHIPLANGIDSLNVSSALALILFELRKHLMQHT